MRPRPTPRLREENEFEAYAAQYPTPAPAPDAEAIAGAIARKHCAGHRGAVEGATILAALSASPDPDDERSRVVSWMLSGLRANECAILVTRCGIRPVDLARHVRRRATHPAHLVRFLNQFSTDAGIRGSGHTA